MLKAESPSASDDVADTEDNKEAEESDDTKKEEDPSKRDGFGGGEGGHHGGDEGGHEGTHGHHEHDHHEHDHNHHDHGYEFYEEWGEHGGHEGEHHGHHEGGHHGEHGHHHGHHGGHHGMRDTVPGKKETSAAAGKEATTKDAAKKWWLVGDHWGGWGHSHWGHPNVHRDGGGWQWGHTGLHGHGGHGGYGGGHGGYGGYGKSGIPDCCKSVDPAVTKRCGCHLGTTGDGGYHFSDHGSGHDDHDHGIQGPWTFGYDHFGDDWSDWDHNHHNFQHLTNMQHLPHDDHHGCGHGRACVPRGARRFSHFYPSLHFEAPYAFGNGYGNGLDNGFGNGFGFRNGLGDGNGLGFGNGLGLGYGNGFGNGLGFRNGYGNGLGSGDYGFGGGLNNYGVYGHNGWPVRRFNNYRVCHKCRDLPSGGSRCLCKSVRHHPLYLPVVHRPAQVYIDCDTSAHKFPHNRCVARADIPTPQEESEEAGSTKQGVFYPYANYGPWSAYPWWGDWWGGHGHHAWGEGHGHAGGAGGRASHVGGHGAGHGVGHAAGGHGMGRAVGFSFGGHGAHLQTYHCKDQVEKATGKDEEATTKRFCVPIGYHGGYGFPYFHGYPGVGTGLWGWGWPWIKNKVPGSKLKEKKATSKDTKKSSIPEGHQTKKQTIHVGYGYASGDNYRLGYGSGGMGGVAGFTSPHNLNEQFVRSRVPSPEGAKDVTGTKRDVASFAEAPHKA